jgi:Na+-driven multidrug efflux pump
MTLRKYDMDLTQGPILKNMLAYSLPVMFAALLQVFYNAADTAVVGKFAYNGEEAMAAVGATSALNNLIINILTGLSVGATAIVARYYGAKQDKEVSDAVHTTMGVGLLGGILDISQSEFGCI